MYTKERECNIIDLLHLAVGNILLLFLPLALQPNVGFGLSNNILPFFPIYHQLSPSSHSQHLKICGKYVMKIRKII